MPPAGGRGGFTIGGTVSITAVPGALLPSRADIKTESIMRSWGEAAIQHQRLLPPPIYHPTLPEAEQGIFILILNTTMAIFISRLKGIIVVISSVRW